MVDKVAVEINWDMHEVRVSVNGNDVINNDVQTIFLAIMSGGNLKIETNTRINFKDDAR